MYILHICTSFTKEILEDVTCEKRKPKQIHKAWVEIQIWKTEKHSSR